MSSLEREVIEKFYQLDRDAQKRVWELNAKEASSEAQPRTSAFDYDAWFRHVEGLRQAIRASHGDKLPDIDVVGLLCDIRDGEDQ